MGTMRLYLKVFALSIAMGLSACAGTPALSALSADDRDRLAAVLQTALEKNRTGQAANWESPTTGRRGTVVPLRTYKGPAGRDCRDFQETATAQGETDIAYGAACRDRTGAWRIVSAPSRYYPRYPSGYYDYDSDFGYGGYYRHYRFPFRDFDEY